MDRFCLDDAVKNIKTIVEKNRCVNCDQLNVQSLRYPCGHLTCNNCVATAEDCLLCLTPPEVSTHLIDEPSSLRVKHASHLLTAFQELFQIDVYKRHRLSEKLKLEKDFFPECFQVSNKYSNKRKSFDNKVTRKQNKSLPSFPGENISFKKPFKMENIENNVEQWMNKNETFQKNLNNLPRKPFTDLSINNQKNKDANNLVNQSRIKKSFSRKRSHLKLLNDTSNISKVPCKKFKTNSNFIACEEDKQINSENNESGVFLDDEAIVIDDSQSILDKDQLALLAVMEADKNDLSADCIEVSTNENEIKTKDNFNSYNYRQDVLKTYHVPFVKKSTILEVCKLCKDTSVIKNTTHTSKNVTVTIDSDSFLTTIKVVDCSESIKCSKHSKTVQTDQISETKVPEKKYFNDTNKSPNTSFHEVKLQPQAKSENEVKISKVNTVIGNKSKCLVIEESDSDSDLSNGEVIPVEVTVECHKSENRIGCNVLSELKQNDYGHRGRHAVREHSPRSTDSSDKENYDPNRMKRQNPKKKCFKNKY